MKTKSFSLRIKAYEEAIGLKPSLRKGGVF